MVTLEITLDTQAFAKDDFAVLLRNGVLLTATGVINRRWEEYSAIEAAAGFGLQTVTWEQTWDDTPGSLTCLLGYWLPTKAEIQSRLSSLDGIISQELYNLE